MLTLTERLTPATTGLPAYDALGEITFEVRTADGRVYDRAATLAQARTAARRSARTDLSITAHHLAPDGMAAINAPQRSYTDPYKHGCWSSFWVFDLDYIYRNIEQTLAALAEAHPRAWQGPERAGAVITAHQVQYFEGLHNDWRGVRVICERPTDGTHPDSHTGDCTFRDWAWNWRTGLPVPSRGSAA